MSGGAGARRGPDRPRLGHRRRGWLDPGRACTEAEFLKTCRLVGSAPAKAGSLDLTIRAVPPGRYAVQAFHDRDGDGRLATNLVGLPSEPYGFSRAPVMRFGPPAFADAAVAIDTRPAVVPVALKQ